MSDLLKLSISGHVATIMIANPPANTWTFESLSELKTLVEALNINKAVYALVITGEGEKFFSAGADLKLFADGDKGVASDMARVFGAAFEALRDFQGVSIAAINGYAMGGGLEVALACDIRVCEEQAQLALPEAKVGLLPCAGGTQHLSWLVGEGWAKRMILCGERLTAEKALQIGLVEEVVAKGGAYNTALALAEKTAEQSPSSITACKSLIQAGRNGSINAALANEREQFVALFDTKDQKEGVTAFLEKRPAIWMNE
ncbi:enoyl-CoA hydratase [Psychrosphaera sp. B3R10]|uniref:Enoyl-CoA hydratase n=1 Tax=Psychrosphaera algicola TaxID=3023714 RepID=A0ABT5F9E0_9GAMM|nr:MULTISPECIES: enoyl-CoA hydratase [unclassified Psychrosphaera]MBU2882824.1 enoyl-CoA hydratase [Psychrosphaera sp. I2R16]MBU2988026.1 enoyl-CoA hydratase [Psychrosphaera sp. B3R10]MDC2888147.1 enoyl-CoA hydratase [Psychrosphaera sp. G1-22]MDO6721046.1 enoyl-CoA hydratase [Psychrosphaera sp. 1_MG-2023]